MDLVEVRLNEWVVVTFDGHVLEFFGLGSPGRYHAMLTTVAVSGPDKKGKRTLTVRQTQSQATWQLDDDSLGRLRPILDALRVAGVSVTIE